MAPSLSCQFTLGRQSVSASGTYTGEIHDNVLRLHIHRTAFEEFLHNILCHLPLLVLKLITPVDKPSLQLDRDEMEKMIDDAFWALAKFVVGYGDIKLDNFHLVNGPRGDNQKIMIVDLESVEDLDPRRGPERPTVYSADHLFRLWREAVESDRRETEEELRRRHAVPPSAEESRRLDELTRAYHLANPVSQVSSFHTFPYRGLA